MFIPVLMVLAAGMILGALGTVMFWGFIVPTIQVRGLVRVKGVPKQWAFTQYDVNFGPTRSMTITLIPKEDYERALREDRR